MFADIRRSISSRISFRLIILLHIGSWQLNVFCDNASRFSPLVSWIISYAIAYKNKESKHASLNRYLQELNKMFTLRVSLGGPGVSLTLWCFVVYSTRQFVICLTVCHFVLLFFSPFSIAITSLGEERANLSASRTFVRFVLVRICRFPLPLRVWEGLRFVIVALPGLFSYLFFIQGKHALKHTFVAVTGTITFFLSVYAFGVRFEIVV